MFICAETLTKLTGCLNLKAELDSLCPGGGKSTISILLVAAFQTFIIFLDNYCFIIFFSQKDNVIQYLPNNFFISLSSREGLDTEFISYTMIQKDSIFTYHITDNINVHILYG